MENTWKAIHISPGIKYSSYPKALAAANAFRRFIKDLTEQYMKKGKNYNLNVYIGVSENNPKAGNFTDIKGERGRPYRQFIPYPGMIDKAFVSPHLHILIVSDHAEVFSKQIIKYFDKWCYKKYHVNSYPTIKQYIDKQARNIRKYSNFDGDPESFLPKRPYIGLPQVLVEEGNEITPDKENNIMENNYNSINNANTQANIKALSPNELVNLMLSTVEKNEDELVGVFENMNTIREAIEALKKILAALLAQLNAIPHGNGYQPSPNPNNYYGSQYNQPWQNNCAPNEYAYQHNAYNDQYAQNNMNSYSQQCNQPPQNNCAPNRYADQHNAYNNQYTQNNMNGYNQQCNQPPQYNYAPNVFADQHNSYNDQYAQNNMNGYNQQCNQPPQYNCAPNGYADQYNSYNDQYAQNNMNGYNQQCNQPQQYDCYPNGFYDQQDVYMDNQCIPDDYYNDDEIEQFIQQNNAPNVYIDQYNVCNGNQYIANNGCQSAPNNTNGYSQQFNQLQNNYAPDVFFDQQNMNYDSQCIPNIDYQSAPDNINGYDQQYNQPQQQNYAPIGYVNQGNGNQNNMNGYSQQCNQPPQFNCAPNEFFNQQNVCIDNQYVPDYGCPPAHNGGYYTNQLAPF